MHTLQLLLDTTAYDRQVIEKRFRAVNHIHNVLVKHARKLLKRLDKDKAYQELLSQYRELKANAKGGALSDGDEARRKALASAMAKIRSSMGLSEAGLQAYIKICAKQFGKCLSSQQVQKEATRVWRGAEAVLFGSGKELCFRKAQDANTIGGKSNNNGVKFDKGTLSIDWLGLRIPCRVKMDAYKEAALKGDISYCEVKRMMFEDGWHYYVVVTIKGPAPAKNRQAGTGKTGIDIGTSTVAAVSEDKVLLRELAPGAKKHDREIRRLERKMDASKRASNPDNFNPDGTVKKGGRKKLKWAYSKNYRRAARRRKMLYRKKAAYTKQSHEMLANEMLEAAKDFLVEEMDFKALQKRSRKTERQEKASEVKRKDGTVASVHKYKRKKRFGRSIANRSPAAFLRILETKANTCGGSLARVKTREFKASQYDHAADTYRKADLGERWKEVGGHKVQRDLYSAFLIRNSRADRTKPNRQKCLKAFDKFIQLHDAEIQDMQAHGVSMKACFGF